MTLALTKSRKTLFKKNNSVYPGFISLSGSWDEFSMEGLCTFSGTIDIANIDSNPSTVDNRKNRTGWMFGTPVEILVEDDNGNFVKPRILPKLYIKNANPYNPESRTLTLTVTCVLGLLSEYSLDHWKNPEKDLNDTEEIVIDDWWADWEKKGKTTVSQIVSKIFQKLQIEMNAGQTLPTTNVNLPWSPSGLIASCGDLCFKSTSPSQLYSDENGKINIAEINVKTPAMDLYLKIGRDEKLYQPTGQDSPLSELIVTGEIPEIVPDSEDTTNGEDGFCTYSQSEGLDYALGETSGNNIILSTESVCEKTTRNGTILIKIVTTIRHERMGLLYPDVIGQDKKDMIKVLEKVQKQEFNTENENRLEYEETITKEPWGRIFGGWYNNHLDWIVTGISGTSEGGSISKYADEARYSTAFYQSSKSQKVYTYNDDKTLRKTVETVTEPISKVLTSFNGDGSFPGFDSNNAITEMITEEWVKNRKNERHTKYQRATLEAKYSSAVETNDSYLREKKNAEQPFIYIDSNGNEVTVNINSTGSYIRKPNQAPISVKVRIFKNRKELEDENGNIVISVNGVDLYEGLQILNDRTIDDAEIYSYMEWADKNFVKRRERLALVSDTDKENQVLSRTGEAAPPPTEHIPNNEAETEKEPEYKNKIIVDRHTWEFPYPNIYKPPREFVSIGVVDNSTVLRRIGEIIYFMRQGKSFSYEIVQPLTQYWIETDFKPLRRIDIDEPDNKLIYLASGITIELRDTESLVLSQLYWLGFQ